MQRRVARLRHRTRRCAPFSRVRFRANRTLKRHRRMTESDPKRTRETLVLEFFQSALVNSTIGVQALRGSHGDHEMIAGLMGPTLLAIGIPCWSTPVIF